MKREWLDEKIRYLNAAMGIYRPPPEAFLFEPTESFYAGLGDDTQVAVSRIARHLGFAVAPVLAYEDTGAENFTAHSYVVSPGGVVTSPGGQTGTPGRIAGSRITVASRFRENPYALGAILAHEMAHFYLNSKGIRGLGSEEEYLTDLAAMTLGLGKLTLNGKEEVTVGPHTVRTSKLGYLAFEDLAHAYEAINAFRGVDPDLSLANLTSEPAARVFPLVDSRRTAWRRTRGVLWELSTRREEVLGLARQLSQAYDRFVRNQEEINRKACSLRIRPKDGRLLVDINNHILQGDVETLLRNENEALARLGSRLGGVKHLLADPSLAQSARLELARITEALEPSLRQLGRWTKAQERYVALARGRSGKSPVRVLLEKLHLRFRQSGEGIPPTRTP